MTDPAVSVERAERSFVGAAGLDPVRALDGVSIDVAAGSLTVLVGPSGSGKTTLLNIVTGLDRATSGSVVALGTRLDDLNEDRLARWRRENTAIIFQAKGLISHLTATENVELALQLAGASRRARRERSLDALRAVGVGTHVDHRPGQLSGGQQQRVAIARALATSAPLLVADEPTGELDSETGSAMIELIATHVAATGATALIATHDPSFRDRADRVIQMADGRLS